MISILHDYGATSSKLIFHGLVSEAAAKCLCVFQKDSFLVVITLVMNFQLFWCKATVQLECRLLCSCCFVKSFYFVSCEPVSSCQECLGECAAVAVTARWTVSPAKVAVTIAMGSRGFVNAKVISASECRSQSWVTTYGTPRIILFPCPRQFKRCPSWAVNQWE